jgi:hypothetical protein
MGRFHAAATRASAAHCPSGPMKAIVELLSLISVMRRMANAVSPSFPTALHILWFFKMITTYKSDFYLIAIIFATYMHTKI